MIASPIFIVGMGRSGTTLLRSMLCAHPAITIPTELNFFLVLERWASEYPVHGVGCPVDFDAFWRAYSSSEYFPKIGLNEESILNRIRASGSYDYRTIYTCICEEYAEKMGNLRWGEKSPNNYRFLDTLLNWYPNARVLYMIRDPRAVVASFRKVPWGSGSIDAIVRQWQSCVSVMEWWADDERVMVVQYETLVTEPEHQLRQISNFIGEDYTPDMLYKRSQSTTSVVHLSDWSRKHYETVMQPVTTANISKWESKLSPCEVAIIEYFCRGSMVKYRYQPKSGFWMAWAAARWKMRRPLRLLRAMKSKLEKVNTFLKSRES